MNSYGVSKKEAASFFDVSVQALDGWFTAGCPVLSRDEHGKIRQVDLAEMARWRIDRRDEDGTTLEIERTRLTKAQADKTELEVQELRGSLIRVPAVIDHWQGRIAAARAKLLALPSKLAARIAQPDKIAEGQDLAQSLIYEALAELASDGIPNEVRERAAAIERSTARDRHSRDDQKQRRTGVATASAADDRAMGGRKPDAKRRGQRRAGKVSDK